MGLANLDQMKIDQIIDKYRSGEYSFLNLAKDEEGELALLEAHIFALSISPENVEIAEQAWRVIEEKVEQWTCTLETQEGEVALATLDKLIPGFSRLPINEAYAKVKQLKRKLIQCNSREVFTALKLLWLLHRLSTYDLELAHRILNRHEVRKWLSIFESRLLRILQLELYRLYVLFLLRQARDKNSIPPPLVKLPQVQPRSPNLAA